MNQTDIVRHLLRHKAAWVVALLLLAGSGLSACSTTQTTQETTAPDSTSREQAETRAARIDSVDEAAMQDAKAAYLRGLEAFEQEEFEQALDYLTAAYIRLPDHGGINYALADIYFQLGDLTNAAYYGKQATRLEPNNRWYHLKLAEIYRRAGKNEATLEELRSILKHNPDDLDVLYMLANTYTRYEEYLKSNEIYNRILKKTGPAQNVYLQKYQNFKQLGMQDSSITMVEKMYRLDPDDLNNLQMLGRLYMENDQPEKAKTKLREAVERNSRDPKSLVMLADIYIKETQWDSARTLLTSVTADTLVAPADKIEIARYLFRQFSSDTSNSALRDITGTVLDTFTVAHPDFGPAYTMSADFYIQTNQPQKALKALEKTNELIPENDSAWRQRVQMLYVDGRYDDAITVGKKANEHVPDDAFLHFFVGSSFLIQQQTDSAATWLQQAAKLPARKSFKSVIYGSLGDALSDLDRWDDAKEAYEEAITLDPGNDNALNNYAYYLSTRDEQLEYAQTLAQRALEKRPDNPSYLDTLGWIYYKLKKYDDALRYIKAALQTGEASATVLEHLGDVYHKMEEPELAREYWQRALDKDPGKTHLRKKLNQ
jgi:tetratricopeptide (TPR) repeat protein